MQEAQHVPSRLGRRTRGALAGSTSWSTATVSARVRTSGFGSSSGLPLRATPATAATSRGVGIAARVQSTSSFYALVLTPTSVQLRRGATTTLASASFPAATGT